MKIFFQIWSSSVGKPTSKIKWIVGDTAYGLTRYTKVWAICLRIHVPATKYLCEGKICLVSNNAISWINSSKNLCSGLKVKTPKFVDRINQRLQKVLHRHHHSTQSTFPRALRRQWQKRSKQHFLYQIDFLRRSSNVKRHVTSPSG